jgi:hypothetical protein
MEIDRQRSAVIYLKPFTNNDHPDNEEGNDCQRRFMHSAIININQRSPAERGPLSGPFLNTHALLVIADLFLDISIDIVL